MDEWCVGVLMVYGNRRAELVEDIAHIRFPMLTYLDMRINYIASIEVLPDMWMPCLR
jgi:hypothetical protein